MAVKSEVTGMIVIHRQLDRSVEATIPKVVVHHSPDGWEYGYEGSGPADLALNILQHTLTEMNYSGPTIDNRDFFREPMVPIFRMAWDLHQDFKTAVIAQLDRQTPIHHIPTQEVADWIRDRWYQAGGV